MPKYALYQTVSVGLLFVSVQSKQTQNNLIFSEKIPKYALYQTVTVGLLLVSFNRNIKTLCFGIETKQPKQTVSKQTKTNQNNPKFSLKNTEICSLSNCFGCSSFYFGLIKTLKLSVSV
jgi:hypothetical protein